MTKSYLAIGGKSVPFTEKSIFRVEESRNAKATYEGVFAHKDPVNAIRYYTSTTEADRKAGFRIRLVKDGDEFTILLKKTFK
jgi:hypothetical protein